MKNSYLDFPYYLKIFKTYLGKNIYLIFFLSTFAGLAESFGILMVLPLLSNLGGGELMKDPAGSEIVFKSGQILALIGLENSIIGLLLLIAVVFMAKGFFSFCALAVNAKLCANLHRDLKWSLYKKYNTMSYAYFVKKNTGYFVSAIGQVSGLVSSLTHLNRFITQMVYVFIYALMVFGVAWRFGLMTLVSGIFLFFLFRKLNTSVRSLSGAQASESLILEHLLIQAMHGFKYMRSTNQSSKIANKIYESLSRISIAKLKTDLFAVFTQSAREPISVILIVCIMIFQVEILEQSIGPVFIAILLFYRGLSALMGIQSAWQDMLAEIGGVEFVHQEFINQDIEKESEGAQKLTQVVDSVELKNVVFSYSKDALPVINELSLKIPSKKSVALVGGSGAGKSTIVDLITLMLRPESGQILINGIGYQDLDLGSWRAQIGYVGQETVLFDDTIANNISLWDIRPSKKILLDDVRLAAKQAHLLDFIENLPQGFDTIIGDRGVKLSGGQRQRLSIARELFRRPSFLILDEATSSLDSESEKEIQNSIDELQGKITVLIIAHRLSTIKNVDCIYVIENGKLVESGSYAELRAAHASRFTEFVNLQTL